MNRHDVIERLEEMETYLLNKSYGDLRARDFYEWTGCALELLKAPKPPIIDPTDDHFQAILTCALRYCMGRATYMPGLVTGWIMGHMRGRLSAKTLGVMKQDIDGTPEDRRGMDCDQRVWAQFRGWLEQEGKHETD